jgi:hypothetical protein
MKKINTFTSLLLAASLTVAGVAFAKANPLSTSMEAYTISVNKDGKEVATKSAEASPQQLIEYRVTYENKSQGALKGLAVTGPIPAATQYKGGSNTTKISANFMVSIDGGKTFEGEPVKRMIKDANGKTVEQTIPASRYTHIRWTPAAGINAGEKQLYSYRVQVK